MANSDDVQKRIGILQSGYRNFVGGVKIPISADTRWLLEVACLNAQPSQLENATILHQAKSFLEVFLWKHQTKINISKQEWIAKMKS